ncbi:RHS repeat-associated core domain-containing protein [Parasphingorhabdus sp.]|uniref:RHS repeat domain-containing protein n=1 Tax=Parasphingorhabdus sp. TaxID=2709688 RepID=UPI00329A120A
MRHLTSRLVVLLTSIGLASTAASAQQIKPLEIEPDGNGVNMLSGQVSPELPPVSAPAAGRLSLSKISNLQPFMVGQDPPGNTASVQVNNGGATSDSLTCLDDECTASQRNGSEMTIGIASQNATYMQGGSGKKIFFDKVSAWVNSGGTLTYILYPSYVQYADGERHTFTYHSETPTGDPRTYYRPTTITSNLGYQLQLTYQAGTVYQAGWSEVATATLNGPSSPNPVAKNTYVTTTVSPGLTETTVTDLASRTWTCRNCANSLNTPNNVTNTTMELPTDTSDSYAVEAGSFSSATQTYSLSDKVTKDGTEWNYDYVVTGVTIGAPKITKVTVTGPESFSRIVNITQPVSGSPTINSITNGLNQTTSYVHDNFARLTKITMPEGDSVEITYDTFGNITEKRSKASGLADIVETATYLPGTTCTFGVNDNIKCFRPVSTTDPAGNVTDYTWHSSGQLLTQLEPADANGNRRKTINEYSSAGGLARKTKETTCWQSSGGSDNCSSVTALVKTYTYWGNTLLPATETMTNGTASLSATTTYAYDNAGRLLSADGPLAGNGDATYNRYDVIGRKTWEIGAQGANGTLRTATRTTYRASDSKPTLVETGTVTSPTDTVLVVSQSLTNDYDANRNLARSDDNEVNGATTTTETVSQFSYDGRNQLECSATRMNKAVFGSLSSTSACDLGTTGTLGTDRISKNSYDVLGRVTKTVSGYRVLGTSGAGEIDIELGYTTNGQVAWRKDGNGNQTSYAYDGFDRLLTTTFPDSSTEVATYDNRSNVITFKKRAGQTITNSYDNTSRLTQSSYSNSDPTVTYVYDGLGRETSVTRTGISTLSYTYDGLGRQNSENQDGRTVSYTYDIAGRRTRLDHPDSFYLTYEYSPAAQVTAIKENGSLALVTYAYDGLGRATSLTRANGITTSLTYDPISRLASYDHSTLVTGSFTYNPASQLTTREVSNTAFTYKALVDRNLGYVVNNLNQYTSATGTTPATFTHDLNGNMTGDGTNTYAYDALNRLTSSSGGAAATLVYGPKGRLISTTAGGTTTEFLYDGSALIAEYVSSAITNRYAHGGGVDDPIVWYEGSGTASKNYLTTDERGSIIGLTDSSGANTRINAYDEWGVPAASNVGRFQYTGQVWLSEIGKYYYKARIYDPVLGRFLQSDPIGYDDGMNMYAYVGGDPINGRDSTGLYDCETEADCEAAEEGRKEIAESEQNMRRAARRAVSTRSFGRANALRNGANRLSAIQETLGTKNDDNGLNVGTGIVTDSEGREANANFDKTTNTITLNTKRINQEAGSHVSSVLAHEVQHARDYKKNKFQGFTNEWKLVREIRGFTAAAIVDSGLGRAGRFGNPASTDPRGLLQRTMRRALRAYCPSRICVPLINRLTE